MSTATRPTLPRTADAVRRVLAEHRPDLHERFVSEFHTALAETDDDFATDRITRLVGKWWAQAVTLIDADTEADAVQARLAAGDDSDITERWCRQPDGTQHAYRRGKGASWRFDRVVRDSDV